MSDYIITTARLGFRTWTNYTSNFNDLYGNEDVTRFIGGPFTKDQIDARYERELSNLSSYGIQYWPLFTLDCGDFIGCCGLRPYSESVYELGFHLLPHHWGKGYAGEAARGVINYAFNKEVLNASSLFAGHNPNNVGSQALLLKLNFVCIGTQYYAPTGLQHPSYLLHKSIEE